MAIFSIRLVYHCVQVHSLMDLKPCIGYVPVSYLLQLGIPRKIGETDASRVLWGDGLGKGDWEGWGGGRVVKSIRLIVIQSIIPLTGDCSCKAISVSML